MNKLRLSQCVKARLLTRMLISFASSFYRLPLLFNRKLMFAVARAEKVFARKRKNSAFSEFLCLHENERICTCSDVPSGIPRTYVVGSVRPFQTFFPIP